MSSKRKWDQPAPGGEDDVSAKAPKIDETKTATEAAAAAAAIAAKIAAQFAGGALGPSMGGGGQKDIHDAEFTFDIDINDLRNRYLLTKGSTQDQVGSSCDLGGLWLTLGVFFPRSMKIRGRP